MENLLEAIRGAIAPEATDDAKAAGASACRTLLAALDAKTGDALVLPSPTTNIAAIVSAIRELPPEQLLDLAISRLRAALPAKAEPPPVAPLKFQMIRLPPKR